METFVSDDERTTATTKKKSSSITFFLKKKQKRREESWEFDKGKFFGKNWWCIAQSVFFLSVCMCISS